MPVWDALTSMKLLWSTGLLWPTSTQNTCRSEIYTGFLWLNKTFSSSTQLIGSCIVKRNVHGSISSWLALPCAFNPEVHWQCQKIHSTMSLLTSPNSKRSCKDNVYCSKHTQLYLIYHTTISHIHTNYVHEEASKSMHCRVIVRSHGTKVLFLYIYFPPKTIYDSLLQQLFILDVM